VASGSAARILSQSEPHNFMFAPDRAKVTNINPLTVLIVVPSLQAGAADLGVVDLVRILAAAGNRPIVLSSGGRLEAEVAALGGELIRADVASKNPFVMMRNAGIMRHIVRKERCDIIHAHGRAPAWSAWIASRLTGIAFVTSWYKGFREQNIFKRLYNSVMARGDRIIAVSDQLAELISHRYGISWGRINVVPLAIDLQRFDPETIAQERVDSIRRVFGVEPGAKLILVTGRLLRRKGHHLVVQAMHRLKDMGLKDFVCVFAGEDHGKSRYTGELWDLVLSTKTADVIRMTGPVEDLPAAYAAASVVVSAATQDEGLQRAVLEAQAMARPVIVSDLGAGPEVVLAPPSVSEDRMTGLRFSAGDDAALAAALIRLFSMPEGTRRAIGARGRNWVTSHFDASAVADLTLKLYAEVVRGRKT
jgi:glycosyltransferase involved in cell wall biosynthesis